MQHIAKFFEIYPNAPEIVLKAIDNCNGSPEHPVFHPEGTLEKHIDIVVGRCMETDSIDLHFTGILHDIMKHGICEKLGWVGENRKGKMKTIPEGTYYQNVNHATHAVIFIDLPEVSKWITSHGANIERVKTMVGEHMRIKNYISGLNGIKGGMSISKREAMRERLNNVWAELLYFSTYCDNMIL
jgi:hypothetical protein